MSHHTIAAAVAALLFLPLLLAPGAVAAEDLPTPASLEPAVRFWTRVYTEVDSRGGLIHDSEHLAVVYETIRLPKGLSHRERERRTEAAKDRIRAVLHGLAKGKRTGLDAMEARVLAQWPDGVSNATLRRATDHVRFQLGQADRFREGLVRSGRWRAYVERALEQRGVPLELVALPHVESSYNPKAYSRIGAAGMWQFTRSTGRQYMRIDSVVDERLDPYIASNAAAKLLALNHQITGSWPLAITAYNHGAGGMKRAARQLGTRDIGEIVRRYKSRTFGFASRNFYASFLAASAIDRDPDRHFGKVAQHRPLQYTEWKLPWYTKADALAHALGVDLGVLSEHNPALRPAVWNGSKHMPADVTLRLPVGTLAQPIETLLAAVPGAVRYAQQDRDSYHKVGRGETLSRIAKRYGVRESELVALNNLRSRHRIRVGQVLVLPDGAAGTRTVVARQPLPDDGVYRVRRGDTLGIIARRFGVSEQALASANGIRNRHRIAVGQSLTVPGAGTPTLVASAAPVAVPAAAEAAPAPQAVPASVGLEAEPEAQADVAPALARAEPAPAEPEPAPEPAPAEPEPSLAEPEPGLAEPTAPVPAAPTAPLAPAPEPPPAAVANGDSKPDPSDYAVHGNRVTVQAEETLGHYAEWLEIRASALRQLNRMRYGEPVVIGKRIKLDFARVTPEEFEQRRLEYHQSLQNEFFDAFVVTGTESHVLKRGESLWYLAKRKYRVPVWLLRQYNPDLDFAALPAGVAMVVPVVEPRTG